MSLTRKLKLNLKAALKNGLFIHYCCDSFSEGNDHKIKIIYIIIVKDGIIKDSKTFTFDSSSTYPIVLDSFYLFLKQNADKKICHWQMQNEKFGFQHIANLAHIHKVKVFNIPSEQIIDIKQLYVAKYSTVANEHLKMKDLFISNGLCMSDYAEGSDEAAMHLETDYARLRNSVYRKTENILMLAKHLHFSTEKIFGARYPNWPAIQTILTFLISLIPKKIANVTFCIIFGISINTGPPTATQDKLAHNLKNHLQCNN